MKKTFFCLILCLIFLFVCACQPTPTEEAVINRADGVLEKTIRTNPVSPYKYDAPMRWEESFFAREQEIRISADIELPESEQYPVTTIKRHLFTSNDAISFLQSFCPGDWSIRVNEYSLDELMTDLQNTSKGAVVDVDEETGELIWETYEGQQERMEQLQKLIEETPSEDTYIPLSTNTLSFRLNRQRLKDCKGNSWYIICRESYITLERYRDGNIQMENWVMQGDATPGEEPHELMNIHISKEDAIAIGNATIESLGLKDFGLADVQKARETQSYTYAVYGEGYWLTYVPTLQGAVPCFYGDFVDPAFLNFTQNDEIAYAAGWPQEDIQMFVTEDGVLFISWSDPKETILTANSNVKLLPFEDIQKNLKKLLDYGSGGGKGSPIMIKRMVLTTSIAQIPYQGDEAFLVPTWAVFLTSEMYEQQNLDMGVLLINALDGSYINRFGR